MKFGIWTVQSRFRKCHIWWQYKTSDGTMVAVKQQMIIHFPVEMGILITHGQAFSYLWESDQHLRGHHLFVIRHM
jgi:hypothetical protein